MFGLFNAIGETLPTMALARQAVTLAKGRSQDAVRAAADSVADAARRRWSSRSPNRRSPRIAPPAGRSCSPRPRRTTSSSRSPTGSVSTTSWRRGTRSTATAATTARWPDPFVWSAGKLAAVTEWADAHDVDLAESYAYSDSVYDTPLLSAVGHPVVVNPDARMVLIAATRRWPTLNLDVSPGVVKIPVVGLEVQQLAHALRPPGRLPVRPLRHRRRREHPAVADRRSWSATTAATSTSRRCRWPSPRAVAPARFLGKKEVFDAPIVGQIAAAMGGIRVDRGHRVERTTAGGRRCAGRRRDGGDHAGGHDPAWSGVLQEAEGPLGSGPAGTDDRRAGHPGRAVGHREGVAAVDAVCRTC